MSLRALESLIAGVKLRCEVVERDRHGRLVAKVFSPNGVYIGRRLVSGGWALAYRRYSKDYVVAEDEARRARRGMWRGTFVKPWEWRASSPPRRTQASVLGNAGAVPSKPLTEHREAALGVDLAQAGEETDADRAAGALEAEPQRVAVVVAALFAGDDQLGHHGAGDRRVLELIAARADRHVEAGKVRLVVDRDPVVGDVVEVDHPFHPAGDRQARDALGDPLHLDLPLLREVAVKVIGVDPLARIARRILAADQDVVADLGAAVAADVGIRGHQARVLEVEPRRERDVRDLLLERARLDLHAVLDAGHPIDLVRV